MEKLIINNVAVPIYENPNSEHFVPPDLEPAFNYYPQYLAQAKVKLSPIHYVHALLDLAAATGWQRTKLLEDYVKWSGNFPHWLKENNALWRKAKGGA